MELSQILDDAVILGDVRSALRGVPANTIDCVVTSPPYYNLREYSEDSREIGREATVEDFIRNLIDTFDEIKRCMKLTGSIWVNIGDSYLNKQPAMVPYRFALEMQKAGYILRNIVQWYKPDAMPESIEDRFSQTYEPFFWFVLQHDYYFNADASKIPVTKASVDRMQYQFGRGDKDVSRMQGFQGDMSQKVNEYLARGVNAGDMWIIPKDNSRTGHPAPYPPDLCIRPIVATCPPNGIVFDPFTGSGTTGYATYKIGNGRKFFGTEINPEFASMARKRIRDERDQLAFAFD